MGSAPPVYTPEAMRRRVRLAREIVGRRNVGQIWINERKRQRTRLEGARWPVPKDETFGTRVFAPPGYWHFPYWTSNPEVLRTGRRAA